MRVQSIPPPSPVSMDRCHTVEQQIVFDDTKLWKLCRVPVDQIESQNSKWDQIKSLPGVFFEQKSFDWKFYYVAVYEEYLPWLRRHKFEFELDLNPLEPVEMEVNLQGSDTAKRNTKARRRNTAIYGILSGLGQGFESSYREIFPSDGKFEWASVAQNKPRRARTMFAQNLVFISLAVHENYEERSVRRLLEKDEDELLKRFRQVLKTPDWHPKQPFCNVSKLHWASLITSLLHYSGGSENFLQGDCDSKYTALDNANLYSAFLGICGSRPFGCFNVHEMRNALKKSRVFGTVDVENLEIGTLTIEMIEALPLGSLQPIDFPNIKLSSEQRNLIHVQILHLYDQHPSFNKKGNDVLMLLILSSIDSSIDPAVRRIITQWAFTHEGRDVYRRMIDDIQKSQTCHQLGLLLAALLCYRRLLPIIQVTTTPSRGSFLADFDDICHLKITKNEQATLERMILSALRVLKRAGNLRQFLTAVLNVKTPVEHHTDGLSDWYMKPRLNQSRNHKDAIGEINLDSLMIAILDAEMDTENVTETESMDTDDSDGDDW